MHNRKTTILKTTKNTGLKVNADEPLLALSFPLASRTFLQTKEKKNGPSSSFFYYCLFDSMIYSTSTCWIGTSILPPSEPNAHPLHRITQTGLTKFP